MTRSSVWLLVPVMFLALVTVAAGQAKPPVPLQKGPVKVHLPPVSSSPTYDQHCASCHGADGRGNADKAKVLKIEPDKLDFGRGNAANYTHDQLKTIIVHGQGKMPAFEKKLGSGEVDPLVDHVSALAKSLRNAK